MSHHHIVKHAKTGSRQAHMNREKFNPYRHKDENQRLDRSILETMTSMCCKRCCDIIQWKVDFGKYESSDRPKRCNMCHEKNIAIAYHRMCQQCAKDAIRCAKCQKPPAPDDVVGAQGDDDSSDDACDAEERGTFQPPELGSDKPGRLLAVSKNVNEALLKYAFVNAPDSDEEFLPYRGLDIRRLKQYKVRLVALREKEERDNMRERERRTVLRKMRQQNGGGDANALDTDEDSDDEL